MVGDTYIPGNITVLVPQYSLGRSRPPISLTANHAVDQLSRIANHANRRRLLRTTHEFIPERWHSKPEMVRDKRAFISFNTGKTCSIAPHPISITADSLALLGNYDCLGQNLARMELRMAIARIVSRFDFRLADGETGRALESELLDLLVAEAGPLRIVCTKHS